MKIDQEFHGKKILGGTALYYWLRNNNWPEEFRLQVLCIKCNFAKRSGKYCPHELARRIDMNGNPIPDEFYPPTPNIMPQEKGPERTAWLSSPEGLIYTQKQSVAHLGKLTGETHPNWKGGLVDVLCAECNATLQRKPCELDPSSTSYSPQFFCDQKCSGAWKKKNLSKENSCHYIPMPDPIILTKTGTKIELQCHSCSAAFTRREWQMDDKKVAKHTSRFCDPDCYQEWKNSSPK